MNRWRGWARTYLAVVSGVGIVCCGCRKVRTPATEPAQQAASVIVLAATSTTELVRQWGDSFAAGGHMAVLSSLGGSAMLARQIESGSPWDLFISADPRWMDELEKKDLLEPGTRRDLMGNDLVLVVPRGKTFSVRFEPDFDFAKAFKGRLAIGDPASVPAGHYARQALENLGWWNSVEDRLIPGADVRQALRLVEMGEADAGIVYRTDAMASASVQVLAPFPEMVHDPIRYVVAGRRGLAGAARRFLAFLDSATARGLMEAHGFRLLDSSSRSPISSAPP